MKAEVITKKEFTPIEIKVTIENERENEAMKILFGYTSANDRADFLNSHLEDSMINGFHGKELLFMEKLSKCFGV